MEKSFCLRKIISKMNENPLFCFVNSNLKKKIGNATNKKINESSFW